MNGFYYIDKPLKYSSFDVIRVLKKQLNIKRIGHTGTLDPLATGGLLIAVGNYTKLIPYLEKDVKEYEFVVNFDGETESFDLGTEVKYFDEEIINKFKNEVTKEKIQEVLNNKFIGKLKQVAPKYSAKKVNGKRAYTLARAGEDFEIKANDIEIFSIEILDYKFPELSLKAKVSAGTYIRSIAFDLARELGLNGSYVSFLRRTFIEGLSVSKAQKLDEFDSENKLNVKEIFKNKQFIKLDNELQKKIDNGLKVTGNYTYNIGEDLFVYKDGNITNIVEYNGNQLIPKKKI